MSTPLTKANIEFTVDEAKALLQLIDAAVRANGLNAAKAGAVLADKINTAFEPPKELDVLP